MYGERQVFNITCICYFATGDSKFNMHKRELLFQEGNLKYKQFLVQTRCRPYWFSNLSVINGT
jgi:hypothetical protein